MIRAVYGVWLLLNSIGASNITKMHKAGTFILKGAKANETEKLSRTEIQGKTGGLCD